MNQVQFTEYLFDTEIHFRSGLNEIAADTLVGKVKSLWDSKRPHMRNSALIPHRYRTDDNVYHESMNSASEEIKDHLKIVEEKTSEGTRCTATASIEINPNYTAGFRLISCIQGEDGKIIVQSEKGQPAIERDETITELPASVSSRDDLMSLIEAQESASIQRILQSIPSKPKTTPKDISETRVCYDYWEDNGEQSFMKQIEEFRARGLVVRLETRLLYEYEPESPTTTPYSYHVMLVELPTEEGNCHRGEIDLGSVQAENMG